MFRRELRSGSVAVVGGGYVGLTTAVCLAHLGHRVSCTDIDHGRIERIRRGEIDQHEPGIDEFVAEHGGTNLSFHTRLDTAANGAHTAFLCLPTPGRPDGSTDLRSVDMLAHQLRSLPAPPSTVVIKSTVPPGTARELAAAFGPGTAVVSNPEFLREGSAVHDFLHPHRIVIGSDSPAAAQHVTELYDGVRAPVIRTDPTSAEIIKHGANFFLAMKLSYTNMLSELCEHLGANITEVLRGVGRDPRIGPSYLRPGPGWGGPCLPKDVRALASLETALGCDLPLVDAALRANTHHQRHVVDLVERSIGRPVGGSRIAVLGLTFKHGTNDLRNSPALAVTAMLSGRHAHITAHDPAVTAQDPQVTAHLALASDAETALDGCDCALLLTDWPEFAELPWTSIADHMRGRTVVDTRDCLDPDALARAGLRHVRMGLPRNDSRTAAQVSS